jgi:hypothetical protein
LGACAELEKAAANKAATKIVFFMGLFLTEFI